VGVPVKGRFVALLALAAAELPSRGAPGGLPGAAPAAPARRGLSAEQARKRLGDLGAELERARRAEKLQYQLDGLQSRLFKLEEALREGVKVREAIDAAEAALRELARVAVVAERLGDLEAKVAAQAKAASRRDDALARTAAERQRIDELDRSGEPRPFWLEPLFGAGVASGVLLFAAGMAGALQDSGLRYLALLDIPAFGVSAWVALRRVGELERRSWGGRRRQILEERERKVQEQYDRDTADIRTALGELSLGSLQDLKDVLARFAEARDARARADRLLADWQERAETKDVLADKVRTEAELRDVEAALAAEAGAYVRDPRSVEAEIARLEQEAAAPPEEPPAPVPPPVPVVEPLRGLLERAAAELGQSAAAVARAIQSRAAQLLGALSLQRIGALQIDDRGNLLAQVGGRTAAAPALPPADQDLCYLALRLALLEQAMSGGRAVAIVDDVFGGLSEGVRRVVGRLLKQVAQPGQLLHATRDPAFREAADHTC
jgi:hypothetical protein